MLIGAKMTKHQRANRKALGSMISQLGITIQTHCHLTLRSDSDLFDGLTKDEKELLSRYKTHLHKDGVKLIELGNKVKNAAI